MSPGHSQRTPETSLERAWLVFRLGPHHICASTRDVEAIIQPPRLTRLPDMRAGVLGVFPFRDQFALAVSLARKLGVRDEHGATGGSYIVARVGERLAGFAVDAAQDVMQPGEASWQPLAKILGGEIFDRYAIRNGELVLHTTFAALLNAVPGVDLEAVQAQAGLAAKPVAPVPQAQAEAAAAGPKSKPAPASPQADLAPPPQPRIAAPPPRSESVPRIVPAPKKPPPPRSLRPTPRAPLAPPLPQVRPAPEPEMALERDTQAAARESELAPMRVPDPEPRVALTRAPAPEAPQQELRVPEPRNTNAAATAGAYTAPPPAPAPEPRLSAEVAQRPRSEPTVQPAPHGSGLGAIAGAGTALLIALGVWLWPRPPLPDPNPLPVAERRPAPAAEPRPAPAAEPRPAPVAEPRPAPVSEPRPAPVAEPMPAPVVEPSPAAPTVIVDTSELRITVERPGTGVPPGSAPAPTDPTTLTHVVARGDTLWAIARRYLKNPYRYPELARLSGIRDPDVIRPGDIVRIRAR